VRFAFIRAEKAVWPVAAMCDVLDVSRSGFYAWIRRAPSARARGDAQLGEEVEAAHRLSRCAYGSPRVHRALRKGGVRVGRKRVARLMRERGLVSKRRKRFRATTNSRHGLPVAKNILKRDFSVKAPNQAWVTDVTCVWTWEGWLYLAVMIDLFSRRVVGWATSESNDAQLALSAFKKAVAERGPERGLIHHSDRGSPYASVQYREALKSIGAIASMSRKGDCWDNAVAESFFATLKGELVSHDTYVNRRVAAESIGEYIERFYNPERIHSTVGYASPIECELAHETDKRAA
jgi:putative transposase